MQSAQPSLFTRPDTFFGICEGLGEDLGFHPNLLRVTLAGLLFWNPAAAIGAYAAAGALVALTRWLVPNPRPAAAPLALAGGTHEPLQANDKADAEPIPLAA